MTGTVYGSPRAQFFGRVPVVHASARQPPLRPALAQVADPREDPGYRPVKLILATTVLFDIALALAIAYVWK